MAFCPKCGQQTREGSKFCRACGTPMPQRKKAPSPAAAPVATPPVATASAPPLAASPPPVRREPARAALVSALAQRAAPAVGLPEEREEPPPPPERGIALTWHRAANGAIRRADEASAGKAVISDPTLATGAAPLVSPAGPFSATVQVALPAAPTLWKFREQTSAWAEQAVAGFQGSAGSQGTAVVAIGARAIRGALMHRDVYRESAQRPDLNDDAFWLAAGIIAAGFVGSLLLGLLGVGALGGFGGLGIGSILTVAGIRVAGWAAAVFAIQFALQQMHQLQLPPMALFRGLIFAQAPLLLSFVPLVGSLAGIWSAVCMVAALQDITARRTIDAFVLVVIGGVASTIAAYIVGSILT